MTIVSILILFLYWFTVWGIFNFILLPKNISHLKGGATTSIFFIFASIIIYIMLDNTFLFLLAVQLFTLFPIAEDQLAVKNIFVNIIFQQLMLYLFFDLSTSPNQILHYLLFIFGITISHFPIFFLGHVHKHGKTLIHVSLPLAGSIIFFTYSYFSPVLAIIVGIMIHFSFYFILFNSKFKDQLGIIV